MADIPSLKLNTGASIPQVALGTWESAPDDVYDAVKIALDAGYRHIDTAMIYGNEEAVGRALQDSKVPRQEIFLTTKLWCKDFRNPEAALDASLKRLRTDYVDLYLMHWPFATKEENGKDVIDKDVDYVEVYKALAQLPTSKAKAVGISNFTIERVQRVLDSKPAKVPAALQVELHVNLPQQKLVDFCHSHGIVVEAYSPLARGNLDNEVVKKIAKKHNVEPANVVLSWGIARNTVVLPKSVTPARIQNNLKVIKLDREEVEELNKIAKEDGLKRHCNYGNSFDFDTFDGDKDSK